MSIQMVDKVNIYIRTTIFAVTKYKKCIRSMHCIIIIIIIIEFLTSQLQLWNIHISFDM
jgi:hypothetical protein